MIDSDDLESWIQPVAGEVLTFWTKGAGKPRDVKLVPFFRLFGKRYALYWNFYTEKEWEKVEAKRRARKKEEEARLRILAEQTIDKVEIGDETSEKEHRFQSERSETGYHQGKRWRHALVRGWFSYEMKVLPDTPMVLLCTYWGSDVGRTFDIFIDDTKIATQTVNVNFPGDFFDIRYKIPAQLTEKKNTVTVKFKAYPDSLAGGVFGCRILKEDEESESYCTDARSKFEGSRESCEKRR